MSRTVNYWPNSFIQCQFLHTHLCCTFILWEYNLAVVYLVYSRARSRLPWGAAPITGYPCAPGHDYPGERHPDRCPCVYQREKERLDLERLEKRRSTFNYKKFPLKEQSHEIFCTLFFLQTAHSDPIRDVFGLF